MVCNCIGGNPCPCRRAGLPQWPWLLPSYPISDVSKLMQEVEILRGELLAAKEQIRVLENGRDANKATWDYAKSLERELEAVKALAVEMSSKSALLLAEIYKHLQRNDQT